MRHRWHILDRWAFVGEAGPREAKEFLAARRYLAAPGVQFRTFARAVRGGGAYLQITVAVIRRKIF